MSAVSNTSLNLYVQCFHTPFKPIVSFDCARLIKDLDSWAILLFFVSNRKTSLSSEVTASELLTISTILHVLLCCNECCLWWLVRPTSMYEFFFWVDFDVGMLDEENWFLLQTTKSELSAYDSGIHLTSSLDKWPHNSGYRRSLHFQIIIVMPQPEYPCQWFPAGIYLLYSPWAQPTCRLRKYGTFTLFR